VTDTTQVKVADRPDAVRGQWLLEDGQAMPRAAQGVAPLGEALVEVELVGSMLWLNLALQLGMPATRDVVGGARRPPLRYISSSRRPGEAPCQRPPGPAWPPLSSCRQFFAFTRALAPMQQTSSTCLMAAGDGARRRAKPAHRSASH
jgi:hypothetical protein